MKDPAQQVDQKKEEIKKLLTTQYQFISEDVIR